jgi:predicted HTH domain antitoxin
MFAIEGVYQNGQLLLQEKVEFTQPVKVIVTFLEEKKTDNDNKLEKLVAELYANDNITLKQAQSLLNHSHWQDTVFVLEQQGCQLYYDKEDWKEELETLALFDEMENSR